MNGSKQSSLMLDLMVDMWKNINDVSTINLIKDVVLNNNFQPDTIGLRILNLQKQTVDNFYKATLLAQEQTEKISEPILKNLTAFPEGCKNMYLKNQEHIKKAVDEIFDKAESYLSQEKSDSQTANTKAETKSGDRS